ncbi:uncharacterized protein LOC128802193 isoform X4 [Vidua chalybeata]|uniref:uncharacterized protein LOC128802193 isoform X4 n=1 Tax=Vidua chalybeata TaxID=81927 RepID=UPI0023A8A47A|nr:uncharacterized protein LOC128802193 isoform X4 [Vidua chalybeata]
MLQGKSGVSQRAHCDPPAALSNGSHVNRALLTRIPQCPAGQRQDRTESTQLATNPRARLTSCPTAISDLTAFFLLPYTHPLFCRMEKAPPRQPKVAWEEVAAPEESSSAEEPAVVTMVEPLQLNARWVPDFAKSTMDFIQAFASSPTQFQDKEQKLEFLLSICTLCRDANLYDFSDDLNDFCSRYKLVEMVQMLLNLEPKHEICTRVRRLAMLAFAQLSTIGTVLETRKVLRLCFNSVFFLRPLEEMSSVEATLCSQALRSMDTMLEVMLLSSPASKISEMMQDMLEILLQYLFSDLMAAQERVLGRIRVLSHLLAKYSTEKTDEDEDNGAASGQIQIAVLGKLLGHLFFKLFRPENKIAVVVDILCSLMTFLSAQKCATLPEDHVQPPEHWESEIISWVNAPNTWKVEAFGRYLRPAERTGVVLEAIEILGRSAFLNKKPPMEFLEEAMKSPEMWLMDVPKVVRHIFAYSDEGNATIAHSFHSLLVLMANKWPGQVIAAALEAAPNFSDKVNLWKSLFSARQTLEKVLKELQFQVQNWHKNIFTRQQQMCLSFLSMLAYGDILESKVRPLYKNLSLLRYPKMEMVPLVLRALETLSESAETVSRLLSGAERGTWTLRSQKRQKK